ncbi:MAG TPA: hypothetical protein PLE74_02220 [Candidatus Cloacimonadota bacterium]|nr:hypothetical protein [Candidatus Cloacimonadota bacterium]
MKRILILLFVSSFSSLIAGTSLLYLEAQGVGGFSNKADHFIMYSDTQLEAMQKPSVGFDYVQKVSSSTKDIATLAIQSRVAYNQTGKPVFESQFYNAYIKFKTPVSDLWIGHDRPAQGLSSYLDYHAELLHNFTMHGFEFDRDWGTGLSREFQWGDASVSATSGSGLPMYWRGNHYYSGRLGYGVYNRDNYTVGVSYSDGKVLNTVGYHLIDHDLHDMNFIGADASVAYSHFEGKFDFLSGKKDDVTIHYALLSRFSVNILPENRLKFESQPVIMQMNNLYNYKIAFGVSYTILNDLTFRSLLEYDHQSNLHMAVMQLYYYHRL